MVILDYTHTFTLQQLDIILTQYLQLGPYFQCLKKVFTSYINRFQSIPLTQRHNADKQHPIKLPINFYKYSMKLSAQIDRSFNKNNSDVQYVYPLTTIIEILNSNQFYQNLPKNTIINSLLTTTNISIIIETLTILSEQMSKLVKSTLDSIQEKQLVTYINTLVSDCIDDGRNSGSSSPQSQINSKKLTLDDPQFLSLLFLKGFNNIVGQEGKKQQQQKQKANNSSQSDIESANINSVVQITGIQTQQQQHLPQPNENNSRLKSIIMKRNSSQRSSALISTFLTSPQFKKVKNQNVLKRLKSLITDQSLVNTLSQVEQLHTQSQESKKQISKNNDEFTPKPKQFTHCQYCSNMRNYLLQSTGFSYFDLQSISRIPLDSIKILKRIKAVINAFTLYLRETNRTTIPGSLNVINKVLANINIVVTANLWEDRSVNPKMGGKYSGIKKSSSIQNCQKQVQKTPTLLNQLQPYYKQVYTYKNHNSTQYTIDQLLRICLKAPQLKQIQKQLVQKYMNQARVKKQGKDIETFIITRQKITNKMNVLLEGGENDGRGCQMERNYLQRRSEPFVNEIQLLKQYEKQQAIINRAVINSKPIYSQINHKYQQQTSSGSQLKRHKVQTSPKNQKHLQKSRTLIINKSNDTIQNQKFKMIIYQQYMRNQGLNVTKNNMSSIINQNVMKVAKSMNLINNNCSKDNNTDNWPDYGAKDHIQNNYSLFHPGLGINNNNSSIHHHPTTNTLSTAHFKTQENDISYDKKQTQLYNKMLLNGQTIRNEVINQVEYKETVIYQSLDDFFSRLNQLAVEDNEAEGNEKESQLQLQDENLVLTMSRPNLKKAPSNKRSTPKNQSSLRNSQKFDQIEGLVKTQSVNFCKKQSSVSVENLNQIISPFHLSNKFKKQVTDEESNNFVQIKLKQPTNCCSQLSYNNEPFQQWNTNYELKKPAWLDQFVDKASYKQVKRPQTAKNSGLLQNQRFLAFQQKNLINQYLDTEQKNKKSHLKMSKINLSSNHLNQTTDQNISKSITNLKRPLSGANRPTKNNKMETIKSLGRGLSAKKRSSLLTKQFVIENNSLLSKIYKQNMGMNTPECARKQLKQEKIFQEFKMNIEKSKFRADKLIVQSSSS